MRLADLLQPAPQNENWKRPPATVATVATLRGQLSQLSRVSQGGTFENHFSELAEPPASPTPDYADLRARLRGIADEHGIAAGIVGAVATDAALSFCEDLTDAELTRWLNIVGTRAMHARGMLRSGQWAIPSVADVPP